MTNQLVFLTDNVVTTSSRVVAEYFGKRHDDVLKAIDNKKGTTQNCGLLDSMFFESTGFSEHSVRVNVEHMYMTVVRQHLKGRE